MIDDVLGLSIYSKDDDDGVLGLSMYSKVSGSMMSSFSELDWLPLVSVVVYMVAAPIGKVIQ